MWLVDAELVRAAWEPYAKAASILPDDPHINGLWVMAQIKLHPAIVISRVESSSSLANESATLSNPSGQAIEVESYLPLSELELSEEVTSLPGLHINLLPLPIGWPKRPQGGFVTDSQGFSDE